MKKLKKRGIFLKISLLLGVALFIVIIIIMNIKQDSYMEDFKSQMKAKGYNFRITKEERYFLVAKRQRMVLDNEVLDIYSYTSDKAAEEDSKRIEDGGFCYNDGNKAVHMSWISKPHFYKKGNIIVQYIGINDKMISDLADIFGGQFVGQY